MVVTIVTALVVTVIAVLHLKWSLDGTYLRWSEQEQRITTEPVSTECRNHTEREPS